MEKLSLQQFQNKQRKEKIFYSKFFSISIGIAVIKNKINILITVRFRGGEIKEYFCIIL